MIKKVEAYFSRNFIVTKQDAQYILGKGESIYYLVKTTGKKEETEKGSYDERYLCAFLKDIADKRFIGTIQKSNLKKTLIEILELSKSFSKVSSVNTDICNIKFQKNSVKFEIMDDISFLWIKEIIENPQNELGEDNLGISRNTLKIILEILKSKKKEEEVKLFYSSKYFMLQLTNEMIVVKYCDVNTDIDTIKDYIQCKSFGDTQRVNFPLESELKKPFVEVNGYSMISKAVKELRKTSQQFQFSVSENSIYHIFDESKTLHYFVLTPLNSKSVENQETALG